VILGRVARGLVTPALLGAALLIGTALGPASGSPPAPAAGGPVGATMSAGARDPVGAGALAVTIDELTPAIPAPEDRIELRGTITNTSDQPVTAVSAVLRVSPTPLTSRGEIPEVLAGAGQRTGQLVAGTRTELVDELAPGATVPFTLTAEVADLPLASAGAYVTGAEALGSTGAGIVRQDIDRTFLPWWPPGGTLPTLLLTTLWPLVGPPVQDAAGVLLSEEPAVQMSAAGRLDTLLGAAAAEPGSVTLLVDPQAVQVAADMADGYEVRASSGPVQGTRSTEVSAWLDRLRQAIADPGADVAGMLYGQPDVVAAQRGRALTQALRQRAPIDASTEQTLGTPMPATVALVPGGMVDDATAARLAAAELRATVLSDRALPLATGTFFTPSGSVVQDTEQGPLPVLLTDTGLSQALMMPVGTAAQRTAAQQRLLAETLTTVTELAETQRLLVAAPQADWSPSVAGAQMFVETLASTPWIEPTRMDQALAREPSTLPRAPLQYGPAQREAELPPEQVADVRAQYADLRAYGEILAPEDVPLAGRTAPTRGLAGWFRTHAEDGADLVATVDEQVRFVRESVRVVSSGTITVSGSSGTIPVTIENLGTLPVTVGLLMTSDPPQLFQAEPVDPIRIEPQRRTSVEVTAQVAAAGPVPVTVTVQVTTPEGRPFGSPGELVVRSSAYADAARILVRVALVALLLAVVVHGVRRARRARRARGSTGPEGPARSRAGDATGAPGQRPAQAPTEAGADGPAEVPRG
jgi:hypothetical protein